MQLTWINYFFWFASPALLPVLAVFMVRRRLHREFPVFFNYTIFQAFSHVAMFAAYRTSPVIYAYSYWTFSVLGVAISFLVLREVFLNAFKPYEALCEFGKMLFQWSCLVLLLIAAVTSFSTPATGPERIITLLLNAERSVRVMQCGLLLFMALFSQHLGVTRRQYLFGIALGYGFYSSVDMIMIAARQVHWITGSTMNLLEPSAYVFSVCIWLGYTLAPAAEPRKVEILPQSEKWNQALATALALPEPEGFLPSMERTVERLLNERGGGTYRKNMIH